MPSASAHNYAFLSMPFPRSTVPITWLLLMLNAMITSATRHCYNPSGLAAENATPCYPDLPSHEHSSCCGAESVCLPTGLCLAQHAVLYVAGCTDPSMRHDACPTHCKSGMLISIDSKSSMPTDIPLPPVELGASSLYAIVPCSDGTWCCSTANSDAIGDSSCCTNADQTFRLDWSALLLSTHNAPAMDKATAKDDLTSQQLARRDDTITSSSPDAATSAIPLRADSDSDDSSDAAKHHCPADRSTIVGLSTGVPLGVCLLAALAAIFVLLSRDRKARDRIRTMAETAREERERAAQEHMLPRLYHASLSASSSPALGSSTNINNLSRTRFSGQQGSSPIVGPAGFHHPSPVRLSPPPQTPHHHQHDGGGGVVYYDNGGGASLNSGGGAGVPGAGTHLSWTTCGGEERESSSWMYEYEGPEARKERFEMTP